MATRAFSCADNLAYMRRAGGHYITGIRMRDGNPLVEQVLSRQSRYQQVQRVLVGLAVHPQPSHSVEFTDRRESNMPSDLR